jgi:hypothetical protein
LGAPNSKLEGQFIVNETDDATVNNNESCAHKLGHRNTPNTNLRCSSCISGFVPVKATGQCRKCETSGEATALITVAALAGIIIFVVLIALKMKSSGGKKGQHSTIKRTLLTHLQMVTIVMSLAVPWPHAVRVTMTFVSSVTSVSSHSSSIQCSTNDGKGILYGLLLCSVLLPLFMSVIILLYLFLPLRKESFNSLCFFPFLLFQQDVAHIHLLVYLGTSMQSVVLRQNVAEINLVPGSKSFLKLCHHQHNHRHDNHQQQHGAHPTFHA